ncbi:hypothetical protein GQ43DRAFT_120563 [Delitschia confertaspora ATCC 74209]|uniref:Uncharacterized protein n=1 Tax=Delitschia confertaspora ATCC 74209 TaxID=1513339 RepID=A0A9P4JLF1_9PLEO|nr:hypothetical protein GQ43DRAFT_120563 [Delitschia confertaspora ATCC 74209]
MNAALFCESYFDFVSSRICLSIRRYRWRDVRYNTSLIWKCFTVWCGYLCVYTVDMVVKLSELVMFNLDV